MAMYDHIKEVGAMGRPLNLLANLITTHRVVVVYVSAVVAVDTPIFFAVADHTQRGQ
jgi:hypothetical protein